ncbi:MAG: DUF1232 domain-containing protein [Anaerolineales bacterium]|nr:DUF1232 domain-containing protein [Anaerolineales bacterium]
MTEKKGSQIIVARQGAVRNFINQFKLILRLMGDSRVSFLAKIIPLGALAYLVMPADLVPNAVFPVVGVLDDAAVLWLGSFVFTELCPPDVVKEHQQALAQELHAREQNDDDGEIIEADVKE